MEPSHRVTRALHSDHMAVIALLQRFTAALDDVGLDAVPDAAGQPFAGLLSEFVTAVEGEVTDHFALEEAGLFPLLDAAGEGGLGQLLAEEHEVILPLGMRVAGLAQAAAAKGFDSASWKEFRRLGHEFAGLLIAHAEKEEIGFVPLLDEILEPEDDARLADAYEAGESIAPPNATMGATT